MKIHNSTFIAGCVILISPLLSFPFIVYDIYKQRKAAIYMFALFLGIIAFLTPPVGDLYRHTQDYFALENISFDRFIQSLKDDMLVQIFAYFLATNGVEYPWARLVYLTIEVSILGYVFNDLVNDEMDKSKRFSLFVTFICGFNFVVAVLGVRHGFAMCLFLMGYYLLYYKEEKMVSLMFFLLAIFTHFFFIPLSAVALLLYYFPFYLSKTKFVFLALIAITSGMMISSFFILRYWDAKASYLEGVWGTDYLSTVSFKGMIYYYAKRCWIIPLFIFFLWNKENSLQKTLIYIFALAFLATSGLATISGRIMDVISFLLMFYYLQYYKECSIKLARYIWLGSLLYFGSNFYTHRDIIIIPSNNHYSEIWKPLPLVLQNDYSKEWIYTHINKDGLLKNSFKK